MRHWIVVLTNGKQEVMFGFRATLEDFAAEVSRVQWSASNLGDGWRIDPAETICREAIAAQGA